MRIENIKKVGDKIHFKVSKKEGNLTHSLTGIVEANFKENEKNIKKRIVDYLKEEIQGEKRIDVFNKQAKNYKPDGEVDLIEKEIEINDKSLVF